MAANQRAWIVCIYYFFNFSLTFGNCATFMVSAHYVIRTQCLLDKLKTITSPLPHVITSYLTPSGTSLLDSRNIGRLLWPQSLTVLQNIRVHPCLTGLGPHHPTSWWPSYPQRFPASDSHYSPFRSICNRFLQMKKSRHASGLFHLTECLLCRKWQDSAALYGWILVHFIQTLHFLNPVVQGSVPRLNPYLRFDWALSHLSIVVAWM